jgi:hypothetical protein
MLNASVVLMRTELRLFGHTTLVVLSTWSFSDQHTPATREGSTL